MDKFFLVYDDPCADKNYKLAKEKLKTISRVDTISGIHASHQYCASQSLTFRFMVLDADCELLESFSYNKLLDSLTNERKVFVCRAINPVNNLVYGHGGLKIFDKRLFGNNNSVDMSTGFDIVPLDYVSNIHKFNTTPFHAWRTAFRECVKLSSGIIKNRNSKEDEYRLTHWCETFNDTLYVDFVKKGALAGREYGHKNEKLENINNFKWLKGRFES